jgi:flagellar biosynthesis regulator FlbT
MGKIMIKEHILIEMEKIRGNLKRLWNLLKVEQLNRNECLNSIREIDRSLANIINLIKISTVKRIREEPEKLILTDMLMRALGKTTLSDALNRGLDEFERILRPASLSYIVSYLENPQTYNDKVVKDSLSSFCKDLESRVIVFEVEYGMKNEFLLLSEFSSLYPLFTPNWMVATIYLTAMEISVKNELKKSGEEIKEKFKENLQLLLKCFKNKNIQIPEFEKMLPEVFWDLRHKVIHEGYSPTDEELKIIREYITRLLEKLGI